jgi:diacylglycerol kinase (ATP)
LKKIHFIINGRYKHTERTKKEIENLFGTKYNLALDVTGGNGHAIELSKKAVLDGADYLIAAGGDGTMNEIFNGVMLTEKEKRKDLIIGLYPLGSGNDFARTMKLTKSLPDLYRLIAGNSFLPIDVGKIEYLKLNGDSGIRYFNNIADIGLGAEVAKRVNEGKKMYGPNFDFFKATVVGFLKYKKKRLKIDAGSFQWTGSTLILCLANAKYFGSGICIAPHAKVNDGKLAITLAGNVNMIDYLKNLSKIRKGMYVDHPELIYKEAEYCTVVPLDDPCLVEVDGEMIGRLPLRGSLIRGEINFLSSIES